MGNQIDAKGIGNGLSLMIFAGIVADWSRVGSSFQDMLTRAQAGASGYYIMIPAMVILALVAVVFVVILTNAERRIPVQYAKRVVGRKMYGGQASYIPIKVNMSGVMPIIFASTLCGLPNMIGSFLNLDATKHPYWTAFFRVFNYNSVLYLVVYVLLIVAFNYFYVAIQYNPVDISNQLRKNNGTIPGIRPGKPTSDFITKTLSKITLIGAVFLAIVAAVPMIIGEIRRFLRDNNALRVSRSLRDTAYRAMQSREELEKQLGREPTVEEIARQAGVELADYFARPELAVYNAIPTAEGCIGILLQQRTRTLWGAEVLVLGFGPVGQALAVRLSALGAGVTVCARRPEQRALAESLGLRAAPLTALAGLAPAFDTVVNTIPAPVLGDGVLARLRSGSLIVDLASKPGGTDFAAAARRGHRAIHALSLPAACAPETAGEAVARTVQTMLQEREGRTR